MRFEFLDFADFVQVDLSVIIFGQPTNSQLRIDEVTVLEGARY